MGSSGIVAVLFSLLGVTENELVKALLRQLSVMRLGA